MIRFPKRIDFIEPNRLHAPSKYYDDADKSTIYEVAESLEERYGIINKFISAEKTGLESILKKWFVISLRTNSTQKEFDDRVKSDISAMWRSFILNEEHGMTTKASEARGSPAFVDTSDYYLNMGVSLIYD